MSNGVYSSIHSLGYRSLLSRLMVVTPQGLEAACDGMGWVALIARMIRVMYFVQPTTSLTSLSL